MDELDKAMFELWKAETSGTWADTKYWKGYVDACKAMLKKHGAGVWDFELAEQRLQERVKDLRA